MKEEGLQKTAQTAMLVNKQSLSQEERSPQGEKAKNGSPPQDNKRVASLLFKSYSIIKWRKSIDFSKINKIKI